MSRWIGVLEALEGPFTDKTPIFVPDDDEKIVSVAVHVKVLQPEDERQVHQALREHRNFIHPHVEVRTGYAIGRPAALSAMGTLEGVIEPPRQVSLLFGDSRPQVGLSVREATFRFGSSQ
jgi:hypothetical protein